MTQEPCSVADPDLELKGGGGERFCCACPVNFSSHCDFLFFTQNEEGGEGGGGGGKAQDPKAPPLVSPLMLVS